MAHLHIAEAMRASISLCFLLVVGAVGYMGQPLEPLTKFRASENLHRHVEHTCHVVDALCMCFQGQTHRKTMDGWNIDLFVLLSRGLFHCGCII